VWFLFVNQHFLDVRIFNFFFILKHFLHLLLSGLLSISAWAQIPAYYASVNFADSGAVLKQQLASLITTTHTTFLSYTPGIWNLLEDADLDLVDRNKVLLIYGFNDNDGVTRTDRTRLVSLRQTGSSSVGFWNREHVFPRSLGTPDLGSSGAGSDGHHLRASDGQMNSQRGNRPFTFGTGNASTVGSQLFYPGDEWIGDIARMMMYMYLRYPTQCDASDVGDGPITFSSFDNMPDIFLVWNFQDPVSNFEKQRNDEIFAAQGNRNPFIDNPYLAHRIWGGDSIPMDAWNVFSTNDPSFAELAVVYPNPSNGIFRIHAATTPTNIHIVNAMGQFISSFVPDQPNFELDLTDFPAGLYHLHIQHRSTTEVKRLVIAK